MKRIILYGVGNIDLRRKIENFLGDGYEIIGYSDGVFSYDIFDGKRFFQLDELCGQEFDFILICAITAPVQNEIRRNLLLLGIPPEKILNPVMFFSGNYAGRQVDLIPMIRNGYHGEKGLIFGMCYAGAIFEKRLDVPFFDCSWSGIDMYYITRIYEYMEKQRLLSDVKAAFLVIPYYFFDYDMSKALAQYTCGKIFSVRSLDDWHHYREIPGAQEYVENFRIFGEKFRNFTICRCAKKTA